MGLPGGSEMIIIFIVILLLFGAKKLPELARGIGKAMGEFKNARQEFEDEIRRAEWEVKEEERRLEEKRHSEQYKSANPVPAASSPETTAQAEAQPAANDSGAETKPEDEHHA